MLSAVCLLRGYELDARVLVIVIVVINEFTHPLARFFYCGKSSIGIAWKVLYGLKELLNVRIIVRYPRS